MAKREVVVWGLSYKSRREMKPVNWRSGVSFGTNVTDLEAIVGLVIAALNSEDIDTKELWDGKYVFSNRNLNRDAEVGEVSIGRNSSFVKIYSENQKPDEIIGELQKKVDHIYNSYSEDLPPQYKLTIPPSKSKTRR